MPVVGGTHPLEVTFVLEQLRARVPGGTGRYAGELAAALLATQPQDARLRGVVASRGGVNVVLPHQASLAISSVGVPGRVLSRLWERGIGPAPAGAVVHAPTLLVPPRRRRSQLVVTIHDTVPWTHPETLTARGVAFHRRMGARAARDAALVVTPTEAVAARVREVLNPRAEVVAVSPGVSPLADPDPLVRQRIAAQLPARPFVLFVGTAEPRKGLDVLVRAMGHPAASGLALVVVGPPGWGDVDVRGMAEAAGVLERVTILGRVSDAELSAVYDQAAVLAMPSRAEGFGLPVIEAMSKGVPVVTSDDPALVEVGAGAALVVPVGDADALAESLATVVDDHLTRTLLAENGLRRVSDFSWLVTASTLWRMYRSLTGGPH
ncbi:MAG TPA: glycosyltransferase family 1 protein [Pedococcus sp.]|nr:glycosyltransferase family 1 protein [Pedococcus sp.]